MNAHAIASTAARRVHLRAVEPALHSARSQVARHRSREDHLARLRTFASLRPGRPVFSHWSAAVVHDLPMLAPLPYAIHLLARQETARADRGIVQHARRGIAPVCEVRGLLVTSVARTVADLAARTSLLGDVVAADAALSDGASGERPPLAERWDIVNSAETIPDEDSRARALAVAGFADGRAESPLESASRVCMALAGAPPPQLQATVEDLLGFRARLDFVWPEQLIAGEADGASKYRDAAQRRGRTPAEVFADQAGRERLVRASGLSVIRWGWETGTRPDRMAALLRTARVPLGPRCTMPGIDRPAIG